MSTLNTSEYTVRSTNNFITHKGQTLPIIFQFIYFVVTSFFINVPLDFLIDVILKRIYQQNYVNTYIPKKRWEILFYFGPNIYILVTIVISIYKQMVWQWIQRCVQNMQLCYGSVTRSNITSFERTHNSMKNKFRWRHLLHKRRICWTCLSKLNGYHENIKFTFEIKQKV